MKSKEREREREREREQWGLKKGSKRESLGGRNLVLKLHDRQTNKQNKEPERQRDRENWKIQRRIYGRRHRGGRD